MDSVRLCIILVALISLLIPSILGAQDIRADHLSVSQFDEVPIAVIESIYTDYNIYYVHTSHGSQIMTGIDMVYDEDNNYDPPPFYEVGDDLGHTGDTTWVPATRTYLDSHPECNMAMFSWCGGCSDNTEEGINIYLNKMVELETDYPAITFIYMTGHLDGSGIAGNLYACNNQIRDFCSANDKILFDFADIESYDPDGTYYPDETDACNWCYDWCAIYTCPTCGGCAHSHCFNCYLKGKAWWWMMARISGWNPTEYQCGDVNGDEVLNIGDVTYLTSHFYAGGVGPIGPADVDECGSLNMSDLTYLMEYVNGDGPAPCEGSVTCYPPTGNNFVTLGCPVQGYTNTGDSVAIPVYLTTDTVLMGLVIGFEFDSEDIEISSIDITGSVISSLLGSTNASTFPSFSPDKNKIKFAWFHFIAEGYSPLQIVDSGLLFTIWVQVPIGIPEQIVNIDTTSFYDSEMDMELILSPLGGGSIKPAYYDCGIADLIISNPDYLCGDANSDQEANVSDAVWIINYVFVGGDPPNPMAAGDANCDDEVNVSDAVAIINYVFVGGNEPCDTNGDSIPDC
jgi:Dockerin type I domain